MWPGRILQVAVKAACVAVASASVVLMNEAHAQTSAYDHHRDVFARLEEKLGAPMSDLLCGCRIDAVRGRVADLPGCPVLALAKYDGDADYVAMPIVESRVLAEPMACYASTARVCRNEFGLPVRGEQCCAGAPEFLRRKNDPHLSVLVPRPVAVSLSGRRFTFGLDGDTPFPGCRIVTSPDGERWGVAPYMEGYFARSWLRAIERYGVRSELVPGEIARIAARWPASYLEDVMRGQFRMRGY